MHLLLPSLCPVLLNEVRDYAEESGRPLQTCINEALEQYLSTTVAHREAKNEVQRRRRLSHRRQQIA